MLGTNMEKLAANEREWPQIKANGSSTVDDGEPSSTDLC